MQENVTHNGRGEHSKAHGEQTDLGQRYIRSTTSTAGYTETIEEAFTKQSAILPEIKAGFRQCSRLKALSKATFTSAPERGSISTVKPFPNRMNPKQNTAYLTHCGRAGAARAPSPQHSPGVGVPAGASPGQPPPAVPRGRGAAHILNKRDGRVEPLRKAVRCRGGQHQCLPCTTTPAKQSTAHSAAHSRSPGHPHPPPGSTQRSGR